MMTKKKALDLITSLAWDAEDGCWMWPGRVNHNGQPILYVDEDHELAHRFAYRCWRGRGHALQGELRPHVPLVPLCGNRRCVNPFHMVPADLKSAVSSPRGTFNRVKTHCPQSHAYAGWNLVIKRDGRRRCRRCHAIQSQARRNGLRRARIPA